MLVFCALLFRLIWVWILFQALEDGLFDYEVRSTVASGEPVKGLELPALCAEVLPTRQQKLSTKGADGPESLREAGNSCCLEDLGSEERVKRLANVMVRLGIEQASKGLWLLYRMLDFGFGLGQNIDE